jgi:AcrR family transcriptional regulator
MNQRGAARVLEVHAEEVEPANRERILGAARTVFVARGYHAATIEQIADEAQLSNGAIYYNFQNKEDLFLALLDARNDERLEHARRTVTAGGGSATGERTVQEEARDITRSFKESREWRLLLLEFVAYAARNPAFAARLREDKRELRAALAEILELHLRAHGITPTMPIDQLALGRHRPCQWVRRRGALGPGLRLGRVAGRRARPAHSSARPRPRKAALKSPSGERLPRAASGYGVRRLADCESWVGRALLATSVGKRSDNGPAMTRNAADVHRHAVSPLMLVIVLHR